MPSLGLARALDRVFKKRETERERRRFEKVRRAEVMYSRNLRQVARHVGELVRGLTDHSPHFVEDMLKKYAEALDKWAHATAERMLTDVMRRDEQAWTEVGKKMGRALRAEIKRAPTGRAMRQLLGEQVYLIKSLPLEAAQRVHKLAQRALETGARADEIARDLMKTGQVTASRARLIARTETSRAASALVQARSEYVGSVGYIWRTSEDSDVRHSHKKMNGQFVAWDKPPMLDGMVGHAGALPNCRCWPDPVIPEETSDGPVRGSDARWGGGAGAAGRLRCDSGADEVRQGSSRRVSDALAGGHQASARRHERGHAGRVQHQL